MRLGILSDSHDQVERTQSAVVLLLQSGADRLIHCGDVGGIETFDALVGHPTHFVWGNTDVPTQGLIAYLETVELSPPKITPLELNLDNKRIWVFHGHEPGFHTAIKSGGADYILHGHSHVARDERFGKTRVINPGALHRARQHTVAILDLADDSVTFLPVH